MRYLNAKRAVGTLTALVVCLGVSLVEARDQRPITANLYAGLARATVELVADAREGSGEIFVNGSPVSFYNLGQRSPDSE
jgi:hypothetical protein